MAGTIWCTRREKLFASIFTADLEEPCRISSNVFFQESHFLRFFFHLPFSPKIPEDLERSVRGSLHVYFSPPLVAVKVFTLFLWNLLHVTHSTRTTRDPGEKEGFHYYCASDKEKPQRKKEKRTMKLARRRLLMARDVGFRLQSEPFT